MQIEKGRKVAVKEVQKAYTAWVKLSGIDNPIPLRALPKKLEDMLSESGVALKTIVWPTPKDSKHRERGLTGCDLRFVPEDHDHDHDPGPGADGPEPEPEPEPAAGNSDADSQGSFDADDPPF